MDSIRTSVVGMGLVALLAPLAAHAAPYDFECDTPPNRASIIDQKLPGPAAAIEGRMSFVLVRGGNNPPSSLIKLGTPDETRWAALQIIGTPAPTYKTAAPVDRRYVIDLVSKSASGVTKTELGKIDPTSQDLAFSLSVAADGAVRASLGPLSGAAKLAPLAAPRARLLCSSGQFTFKGVDAR